MAILVLIRHGQSLWNAENRFTGWTDIDLSKKGEKEAKAAGADHVGLDEYIENIISDSDLLLGDRLKGVLSVRNLIDVRNDFE